MNKENEEKIITFLESLEKSIAEKNDISLDDAPEFIQELWLWYTVSSSLWIVVGILVLVIGIWLLVTKTIPELKLRLKKLKKESEEYNKESEGIKKDFKQRMKEFKELATENEQYNLSEEQEETYSWRIAPLLYLLIGIITTVYNTSCLLATIQTPQFVVLEEIVSLSQESKREWTPLSVSFGFILLLLFAAYLSTIYREWKKSKCPDCGKHRLKQVSLHNFLLNSKRSEVVFEQCEKCGKRFRRIIPKVKREPVTNNEEWNHYCKEV